MQAWEKTQGLEHLSGTGDTRLCEWASDVKMSLWAL